VLAPKPTPAHRVARGDAAVSRHLAFQVRRGAKTRRISAQNKG